MNDNNDIYYNNNEPDSDDFTNIEHFMRSQWSNYWVGSIAFCDMCGIIFEPTTIIGNVWKVKKDNLDLFFCEQCYREIQKRGGIKKWEKMRILS